MYAEDLVVIAETEDELITRLIGNRGMPPNQQHQSTEGKNMNKTKVLISGQ